MLEGYEALDLLEDVVLELGVEVVEKGGHAGQLLGGTLALPVGGLEDGAASRAEPVLVHGKSRRNQGDNSVMSRAVTQLNFRKIAV